MRLTLRQIRNIILFICFGLICAGGGWWLGSNRLEVRSEKWEVGPFKVPVKKVEVINKAEVINKEKPADKEDVDFSLFWRVWQELETKYLDKGALDPKKMVYGAIVGMTSSLGDPYTVFLPPKENKTAKENLNGAFEGVGIRLGYKDENKLAVIAPLKGMPAESAGVKAGDLILKIDDQDTTGVSLPEAVELIRGPKGTKVKLTLLHEGAKEPYEVEIIRDTIVVPSVEVEFLDAKGDKTDGEGIEIAHLKLIRFGELTAKQWDESIEKIKDQSSKIKGVILDVRGNPGGYLKGSVNLASEFLESGVIVKQESADGSVETYSVNRRGRLTRIPMVVLIDQGSASASEILAGALRDYDRVKLVGEKSFGKGTIQEAEDLGDGAGLHITTAKWLTPKGTWVDENPLEPDFEVKNDPDKPEEDKQLEKAVEVLLKS